MDSEADCIFKRTWNIPCQSCAYFMSVIIHYRTQFLQPSQIPTEDPMVVSKYVDNPLCIDGMHVCYCVYVCVALHASEFKLDCT